jgi:uncharacterized protein (TIGR03067 family)
MSKAIRPLAALTLFAGVAFAAPLPKELRVSDPQRIQGKWQVQKRHDDGVPRSSGVEDCFWTFQDDGYTITDNGRIVAAGKFTLNTALKPRRIELRHEPKNANRDHLGLYEVAGDDLVITIINPTVPAPDSIDGKGCKIVFQRVK